MAGHSSIISEKQRANTVRPESEFNYKFLNPTHDDHNEPEFENKPQAGQDHYSWEAIARKYEELEAKMAEQFEDQGGVKREAPPAIRTPEKPTKE